MALTEAQTKLVKDRQRIVKESLQEDMMNPGYSLLLQLPTTGDIVHARNLMRAKAALHDNGNLHKRKVWRLQAAELRYPASAFAHNIHGNSEWGSDVGRLMASAWIETVVGGDPETWTPRTYSGGLLPVLSTVTDEKVTEWLGVSADVHSYPNRPDPFWAPASFKERISDAVKTLANGLNAAWVTENADRYNNTVRWIESLGGWSWKTEGASSPTITIDVTSGGTTTQQVLTGNPAVEWSLTNLEAWAAHGARTFFLRHAVVELKEKMDDRRITLVNPDSGVLESRLAVDLTADEWAAVRGGDYRNAVAFDEDADQ